MLAANTWNSIEIITFPDLEARPCIDIIKWSHSYLNYLSIHQFIARVPPTYTTDIWATVFNYISAPLGRLAAFNLAYNSRRPVVRLTVQVFQFESAN